MLCRTPIEYAWTARAVLDARQTSDHAMDTSFAYRHMHVKPEMSAVSAEAHVTTSAWWRAAVSPCRPPIKWLDAYLGGLACALIRV